ncbi:MAG TPA: SRPBCC family protein [Pseudonocardia sp.]|nr:SRPBCC family protein [Pseudonocardia sp.]
MIRSHRAVAAPAAVVHTLLTDVTSWRLWSPHISRVDAEQDRIDVGWSGVVTPWFGPGTRMDVTWCEPGRGIRWTSTAAGYRLDYADLVEPDGDDRCTVTMTAALAGPAGAAAERVIAPLSAYGQRRRLARLGMLAEYLHRRTILVS